MSLSIDELSSLYGLNSVNGLNQTNMQNVSSAETEKKAMDGDSYISTIAELDETKAIPSENYNDLAKMIKSAAKTAKNVNATEYSSVYADKNGASSDNLLDTNKSGVEALSVGNTDDSADVVSASGQAEGTASSGGSGSSGGGSSDSDETETEIVTINGQTYLQTTTTDSNGNTTVTREPIGIASAENKQFN